MMYCTSATAPLPPLSGSSSTTDRTDGATVKRDYYDVLGVDRDACEAEIKRAFRKLARENHPDVNPEDPRGEARFKEGAEAYEVLSDADKRAAYDRDGFNGLRGLSLIHISEPTRLG